ncbi:MAG: hypothetical protein HFF64_00565 [Oscillospiraceae bacterium]|nr:hypothetical protein [Oscillospiraceae bacterium]
MPGQPSGLGPVPRLLPEVRPRVGRILPGPGGPSVRKAQQRAAADRRLSAPWITGGRTMLPLRFLTEALGGTIRWENGAVYID